jgi:hypothetical protein
VASKYRLAEKAVIYRYTRANTASISRKIPEIFQYRLMDILVVDGVGGCFIGLSLFVVGESVTYSPGGKNEAWVGEVGLYFSPEPVDVGGYGMLVSLKLVAPHQPKEFFAGITMAGMGSQKQQKLILFRREVYLLIMKGYFSFFRFYP